MELWCCPYHRYDSSEIGDSVLASEVTLFLTSGVLKRQNRFGAYCSLLR